jgi:hypothetical protein
MKPMHRNRAFLTASCGCLLLLVAGCASVKSHWPFASAPAPAPQAVGELIVTLPAESAPQVVLQFWERNTLVIDLQSAASAGHVQLTRREEQAWPARIAVRMSPTRFEQVEVQGAQRIVLPVSSGGPAPVTVELPPGAYVADTAAITIRWGTKSAF